ncbi:MAG: hypothetical protein ABIJ57_15960, partial [Pseudomonadota bacterium]
SVPFSPGASVSAKKWLTTRSLRLYQEAAGAGFRPEAADDYSRKQGRCPLLFSDDALANQPDRPG